MILIIEAGARWPWTTAESFAEGAAKLGALMAEDPATWATGGLIEADRYRHEHDRRYLDQKPRQITADQFDDMLNVLPPLDWTTDQGVNRFTMSEFTSGPITTQYGRFDGIYLERHIRWRDRSTYLSPLDFQPGRFQPMEGR